MKTFLILAACLASTFAQCPSTAWTLHPGGRRCFLAQTITYSYADAQAYCRKNYYGFLATINNTADTTACLAATSWGPTKQFWFGLQQKTTYTWDEGKDLSYSNWKSGSGPVSPASNCIAFESTSGKWITGSLCTQLLPFICEAPAMYTCPFEKLQVSKIAPLVLETDGVSNLKTVSNYNCTKEISVAPEVNNNENLHIKIKAFKDTNAGVIITDAATGRWLYNYYFDNQWTDQEFNTYLRSIRIEVYAKKNGNVACRIEISTLSEKCLDDTWTLFADGTRCLSGVGIMYNYTDAQQYCRSMYYDAPLATVRSSSDNPAFNRATSGLYPQPIWIGMYKNATTKSYVWDDGSNFGYTNWLTGPSSAVSDCVAYNHETSKWITGTPCSELHCFICETKPIRTCPYFKYQVSKGSTVLVDTDDAYMEKTVTRYNCSYEVSVMNKASETVLAKIKIYATQSAFVRFSNITTRKEIKRYSNTYGLWISYEFNTNRDAVRVEMYAANQNELGAVIYFQGQPI